MDAHVEPALARWFEERVPASGALDPGRLLELADDLVDHADLWRHLVQHDDDRRVYARIHRDEVLDAWLIC